MEALREMRIIQQADDEIGRPSISLDMWLYFMEVIPDSALPTNATDSPHYVERGTSAAEQLHVLVPEATRQRTRVFSLSSDPSVAVVYRQFCRRPGVVGFVAENGVKDFWFLSYLENSGVVPKVYGISQALEGDDLRDRYGVGAHGKLTLRYCSNKILPSIRYIIMERIMGFSVEDLVRNEGTLSVSASAHLGEQMVNLLERIHSAGVIHGDVHWGNFIVEEAITSEPWIKMIDFERAAIYDAAEFESRSGTWCNSLDQPFPELTINRWNSPWESMRCPPSFRDDMFRVLLTVAAVMHGQEYARYFTELATAAKEEEYVRDALEKVWRKHRFGGAVFNVDSMNASIPPTAKGRFLVEDALRSSDDTKFTHALLELLNGQFAEITYSVLSLDLHDRPDYQTISATFRLIALESE